MIRDILKNIPMCSIIYKKILNKSNYRILINVKLIKKKVSFLTQSCTKPKIKPNTEHLSFGWKNNVRK